MKLVHNSLSADVARWTDPGGQEPNGAGSPARPYNYIEEISGEAVIELETKDAALATDDFDAALEELLDDAMRDAASGIVVLEWDRRFTGDRVICSAIKFDAHDWQPPEPDYDDLDD